MTANVRVLHHTTLIERMHTSKAWGGRQVLGPGLRRLLASERDAGARPVLSRVLVLGRLLQPRLGRAPVRKLLRTGILIMVPTNEVSNFTSVTACQFTLSKSE